MKIIAKTTSILLTFVLAVASATAGIRHYCDYTTAYSESGRIAISGLTIQGTPDYSTSYSYDLNGNPIMLINSTGMENWLSKMWNDYNMTTRLLDIMKIAGDIA